MKNPSIFNLKLFFVFEVFLEKVKQSIESSIGFILIIINLKIVTKELLDLLNLIET